MGEKSGLEIVVGIMGKGILLGVGLWGLDKLVKAQQQRDRDNLKMMSDIAVDVATRTVQGVGEGYMATMLGPKPDGDDSMHGDQNVADNDPMNSEWVVDNDMEKDWTDYTVPSIDTEDGNRIAGIEPGESLIPGIPRPDLGGEDMT